VIRYAVWLYFRFTLSLRDVEEPLGQRGAEISSETIRCGTLKFGRMVAHNLGRSRPRPTGRRHHDELVVEIGARLTFLWRAVHEFLSTHAAVYKLFNLQPHRIRRPTLRHLRAEAHRTWAAATAAA